MNKLIALWLCAALYGCGTPTALPEATSPVTSESQIIVIGKFELVPPLNPELEQKTHTNILGDGQILNRILMMTGDTAKPVSGDAFAWSDAQQMINATWGVPYIVKSPRRRTFLNGGMVQLDLRTQDKLWFPGGYYFDVPKDASTVYIGTLRYTRNDFNTITKIEVIDDRKALTTQLNGQFKNADIRLSLLKKVK
jgi:hypothetical protein